MATRKAIKACLDATADAIPGVMPGSADLTGNTGHVPGRGHRPVGRASRAAADPLRHPRARDGRHHERHGRPPRGPARRGHVLRVQRLHARRGAPRRALRRARHLLVDPRLDRARPGRPHPPARRAAGRHAGHARPAGDPSGRRQRDGPGLADRRRRRRPDRPHPVPPGSAGPGRDGLAGRPRRVPGRLRPGRPRGRRQRPRSSSSAPAARSSYVWPLPTSWPTDGCRPGWSPSPPGTCSPASPTPTGARCCRAASPGWPSRRPARSDGSATPTPRWVSTTSAPRHPGRSPWRSSASPPTTLPPRPPP